MQFTAHTNTGDIMNKIIESYCEFIKRLEMERDRLLQEIHYNEKDVELNKQYLEKYNKLLERNYEMLWNFINHPF